MKRCPQCDFIHEDEQNLCDLDGSQLIYDPRTLPKQENAAARPADLLAESYWRNTIVAALSGIILAAVLFVVYYVFWRQTALQNTNRSPVKVAASLQSAPNLVPAAPVVIPLRSA